ncbi:MAG: tRNA 2-thiouridine(34) synthase MnmA [Peptococcaceae bacterium]|nr:MAG: tRNA 2-thiouridine(34) synthase MnmA [Peptococcaceae bacterium]
MSGGVDSSVAAALLQEQGYDVTGVTMQIWDSGAGNKCCSLAAVEDARRVAYRLGIPYYVMNFRDVFKEKVIDYFTAEYRRGRTPNPCIACNRFVKFEVFLYKAFGLGADFIATGHYARPGYCRRRGRYIVRRAKDQKKDQTYVLYGLTQPQMARTLMPLGDYTKDQVRRIASRLDLPVADKAESQEICFIADDNYRNFLAGKFAGEIKPGPFLDIHGRVIGRHRGIPYYTVGQRRGLGLSGDRRLYVVAIDPEKNTVTVGPEEATYGRTLEAADLNLILYNELVTPLEVEAQIRYNARPAPATVSSLTGGRLQVYFHHPQRSITPGQAVVFYQGDYLVGGAVIEQKLTQQQLRD